jgi:DNA-binding protein YbaB
MFGQLKDMYNLQKQAREMKKQLEAEEITGYSKDGQLNLTINGSYDLIRIHVKEDVQLSPADIEKAVKQAYDDANSRIKSILAEKFKGMM